MKIMIFLDNSNLFKGIRKLYQDRGQDRVIDYYKINKFILKYLKNNQQYKDEKLSHIRTYYYDGEYTDNLITKIKYHLNSIPNLPENQEEINKVREILDKAIKRMESQKKEMKKCSWFYFFETRLKPLQYREKEGVFQKGVDVQLAVDLVSNAYLNNYDVAVVFSGDIDLYESVKMVKTLGKHVIIISHRDLMANKMIEISDYYINICNLDDKQLDEFTHIFQPREINQSDSLCSQ
ncbi:MAG: NYN domain-containing protein [Candidatus Pacearchaeota archaeon]|nr:NYN domain-containing protein [Candidatus Pacearchaeota archaeon]